MHTKYIPSPVGWVEIKGTDDAITQVWFVETEGVDTAEPPPVILQCAQQLQEYFEGKRFDFDVPIAPQGSEFQLKVWDELKRIDYADTTTYGNIAKQLNDVNASRAVGLANGKNPIAIILPCHRVIGENGKLTGYAGGLWRKEWLLTHEGKTSGKLLTLF